MGLREHESPAGKTPVLTALRTDSRITRATAGRTGTPTIPRAKAKRMALPETPESGPTVTVYPDGPLVLRGGIVVTDVDGVVLSPGRVVALCRCGRSAQKPFCDSSHKRGPLSRTGAAES